MDFAEIRRLVIIALFSDDVLMDKLVLKGGNAIALVYQFGFRKSLDLDFSIDGDFDDLTDVERRMFRALDDRFSTAGFIVFDKKLTRKPGVPSQSGPERWGGYELTFKLIESARFQALRRDPDALRRQAMITGTGQSRTFTVDFSKYEYCVGKREVDLDHFTIYIYSPEMLAIEKLRAICQQMSDYPLRRHRHPRARDFYDIHLLVTVAGLDLASPENRDLIRHIFAAKDVPLRLLGTISSQHEFHRQDWPAVRNSVQVTEDFDFYFQFVMDQVERLKTLWTI